MNPAETTFGHKREQPFSEVEQFEHLFGSSSSAHDAMLRNDVISCILVRHEDEFLSNG